MNENILVSSDLSGKGMAKAISVFAEALVGILSFLRHEPLATAPELFWGGTRAAVDRVS